MLELKVTRIRPEHIQYIAEFERCSYPTPSEKYPNNYAEWTKTANEIKGLVAQTSNKNQGLKNTKTFVVTGKKSKKPVVVACLIVEMHKYSYESVYFVVAHWLEQEELNEVVKKLATFFCELDSNQKKLNVYLKDYYEHCYNVISNMSIERQTKAWKTVGLVPRLSDEDSEWVVKVTKNNVKFSMEV